MLTMTPTRTIYNWPILDAYARAEALSQIVLALQADQIVVLPSETRYALVARGDSENAVSRLIEIKGRGANQPISLFLPSREEISTIAHETPLSVKLAERFLPGPMTLVLNSRVEFPGPVIPHGTIGIRVSNEPILALLFQRINFPLTATSANRSGSPECTTVEEIIAQLGESPLLFIDDGLRSEVTSTVVEVRGEESVILREGAISRSQIEAVVREMKVKK